MDAGSPLSDDTGASRGAAQTRSGESGSLWLSRPDGRPACKTVPWPRRWGLPRRPCAISSMTAADPTSCISPRCRIEVPRAEALLRLRWALLSKAKVASVRESTRKAAEQPWTAVDNRTTKSKKGQPR